MLAVRGEVSRCRADAAEAMLSVWRAERGKGSKPDTSPRWCCRVWDAISGMSWERAVEAEEMTSGDRALVGEARVGKIGESRTWGLSNFREPLEDAKAYGWGAQRKKISFHSELLEAWKCRRVCKILPEGCPVQATAQQKQVLGCWWRGPDYCCCYSLLW